MNAILDLCDEVILSLETFGYPRICMELKYLVLVVTVWLIIWCQDSVAFLRCRGYAGTYFKV